MSHKREPSKTDQPEWRLPEGDELPPGVVPLPPLHRIIRGEVTPEDHAYWARLDEMDRVRRWKDATLEERGAAVAELLDLVPAAGQFPPQRTEFPGFPGSPKRPKRIRAHHPAAASRWPRSADQKMPLVAAGSAGSR